MSKPVFLFSTLFFTFFVFAETNVYKISMMGAEIGRSTETWSQANAADGSCELTMHSVSEMSLARGVDSMTIKSDLTLSADCRTFEPKRIKGEISEGGSKIFVEGINRNGTFETSLSKNGNRETSSFQMPKNTVFFGMIFRKLSSETLLKGGKTSIISEESLTESEISYSASKNADGTVSATVIFQGIPIKYTVSGGKVLRSEIQNGLIVYTLESLPEAKETRTSGNPDILQNTKLLNKGITVKSPRKAKNTTFQIKNGDFASIPETCFQKKAGENTLVVTFDASKCRNIPAPDDTQSNIIEDSNNPEIIRAAQKIVLGAPNQTEMVNRIAKFVYKHISSKNYNHGNMSAGEVLRKKSGDCTEHSALFAALSRAAGIPTKMVYGVVMNPDGEFFFHNWNEAFADGKWVTIDSTFDIVPADSSRITLIYGGSDSRSRENVSLSVLRFLNNTEIFVRGFSNEQ
ncbi:transglutaminase domain-containing protein [bacterium]|nr:transglutaminase domain-containing protein [bacterium]MBP5591031.1 transglutaminase domain-containing protein [bacterium]